LHLGRDLQLRQDGLGDVDAAEFTLKGLGVLDLRETPSHCITISSPAALDRQHENAANCVLIKLRIVSSVNVPCSSLTLLFARSTNISGLQSNLRRTREVPTAQSVEASRTRIGALLKTLAPQKYANYLAQASVQPELGCDAVHWTRTELTRLWLPQILSELIKLDISGRFGGRTRIRTWDLLIKSQLLYQLSYAPAELAPTQHRIAEMAAVGRKSADEVRNPVAVAKAPRAVQKKGGAADFHPAPQANPGDRLMPLPVAGKAFSAE
jgi:hypothetical protein